MSERSLQLILLSTAWLAYGALHSLLASSRCKAWVTSHLPTVEANYRIFFNLLAVALLIPPVTMLYAWRGTFFWEFTGLSGFIANALTLLAVAGFLWTLRDGYDGASFLGLRQNDGEATLHLGTLHRYVRHPWYFLGLIILWTRDMDDALLVSAICITLYVWIGARLEDRKLIAEFGEAYVRYQANVSGLFPIPGRTLTRAQAHALISAKRESKPGSK